MIDGEEVWVIMVIFLGQFFGGRMSRMGWFHGYIKGFLMVEFWVKYGDFMVIYGDFMGFTLVLTYESSMAAFV